MIMMLAQANSVSKNNSILTESDVAKRMLTTANSAEISYTNLTTVLYQNV